MHTRAITSVCGVSCISLFFDFASKLCNFYINISSLKLIEAFKKQSKREKQKKVSKIQQLDTNGKTMSETKKQTQEKKTKKKITSQVAIEVSDVKSKRGAKSYARRRVK